MLFVICKYGVAYCSYSYYFKNLLKIELQHNMIFCFYWFFCFLPLLAGG